MRSDEAIEKGFSLLSKIDNLDRDSQKKYMKDFISSIYQDFNKELSSFGTDLYFCISLYKSGKFLYLYKNLSSFTDEFTLAAFFTEKEVISFLKESPSILKGSDLSDIVVQKVFLKPTYSISKR